MSETQTKLKEQYQTQFSPEKYKDEVVGDKALHGWERFFSRSLHLAIATGKLKGPRGIDIGCGPTVHRMATLGLVCDEIIASEFVERNREYVKRWLNTRELDNVHRELFKFLADLEGHQDQEGGANILEARVRAKVKNVVPCDVTSPQPIGDLSQFGGSFDVAISCGCLEAACLNYEQFSSVTRNIATLLKPGAYLALLGYMGGDHYFIDEVKFECLKLDQDMVRRGLLDAGFQIDTLEIEENVENLPSNTNPGDDSLSIFCCICNKM